MQKPIIDDDKPPIDLDDLMQRFRRRLADLEPGRAFRCESRQCRRARRCVDVAMPCAAHEPMMQP